MCIIVFVSVTIFNVQISPTFCERMYVCACVSACVRAVCFVFKYFCFLGSFFVLCCMPLTSKTLRRHIGLRLSVLLAVCPYVCLSVCLHAHPQFGTQKDRQLHRQRGKSIVQHWLVRVRKLQLFIFFLSFCACMQSVCLFTWIYTHMIVRMHAHAHTYQPTDRQTESLTVRQTDRQTPPERQKEIVFFTG